MQTEKRNTGQSRTPRLKRTHRCSVCGIEMTPPQSILSVDGTGFCDACYRDSFFDEMGTRRRQLADYCDA